MERLWKSIKYEQVCLRPYKTVGAGRSEIGRYLAHLQQPASDLNDGVVGSKRILLPVVCYANRQPYRTGLNLIAKNDRFRAMIQTAKAHGLAPACVAFSSAHPVGRTALPLLSSLICPRHLMY